MKKVITICLLVVSLFVGGWTLDAKTTKKKTKTRTSQASSASNVSGPSYMVYTNDFFKFSKGKLLEYKDPDKLYSYLENKGYKIISSTIPFEGWIDKTYENNGIVINISIADNAFQGFITINFVNSQQTELFLSNLKSTGWKKYSGGNNFYYAKGYVHSGTFEITRNGNEILIQQYDL